MYALPSFEHITLHPFEWPHGWNVQATIDTHVGGNMLLEIVEYAEGHDRNIVAIPYDLARIEAMIKRADGFSLFRPKTLFPNLEDLSVFLYAFGHWPIREFQMRKGSMLVGHGEVRFLLDRL